MECPGIKEKLSDYIEDLLSSEEKMQMDEHLRTCIKCSFSLEDIKKTIAHVQGLEEVEPPPWLLQKVMTRVREEAGRKKGILQKLFYPLHVKVPIEVIATLAVVITTIYVFRAVEPMMKQAETLSEQNVVSEQEDGKTASVKDESSAYKEARLKPRGLANSQILDRETDVPAGKRTTAEEPSALGGEKTIPKKLDKTFGLDVERKVREPVLREEYALTRAMKEDVVLTVYIEDVEKAVKEVEGIIKGLGGKIIKAESFENKDVLVAGLSSKKIKELLEKIRHVGKVEQKDALYAVNADLEIKIEIVEITE